MNHNLQNLRVLHVLHHSLPSPLDGYAIRAHSILRAQQMAGLGVSALTGRHDPEYPYEDAVVDGIRYSRTPSHSTVDLLGIRQFGRYSALVKRLSELVQSQRPDLIHVHSPAYNGMAALRVARQLSIPLVYEVRATWEDAAVDRRRFQASSLIYKASRALETYLLRSADAVVTICDGLRTEVLSRGVPPEKAFVAPNGVNVEDLQPQPRNTELAASLGLSDGIVLGFIGSLFAYEGVEDLLDVVPEVLQRCPSARFLIVGGGERQAEVAERAQRWGGTGVVVYKPRVPHAEVRSYYSLMDCMVYPRRSVRLTELVTPLKPLEAMAMEKVVVASDIGGHRELVENSETGVLYPAGDSVALANALCRVVDDAQLRTRLTIAAKRYVNEKRTWATIINGHFSAYETALRTCARQLRTIPRAASASSD